MGNKKECVKKLQEIIDESKHLGANILIINNELKPQQTYNLNEELRTAAGKHAKSHLEAWDRIDIILKIFQKHRGIFYGDPS